MNWALINLFFSREVAFGATGEDPPFPLPIVGAGLKVGGEVSTDSRSTLYNIFNLRHMTTKHGLSF